MPEARLVITTDAKIVRFLAIHEQEAEIAVGACLL